MRSRQAVALGSRRGSASAHRVVVVGCREGAGVLRAFWLLAAAGWHSGRTVVWPCSFARCLSALGPDTLGEVARWSHVRGTDFTRVRPAPGTRNFCNFCAPVPQPAVPTVGRTRKDKFAPLSTPSKARRCRNTGALFEYSAQCELYAGVWCQRSQSHRLSRKQEPALPNLDARKSPLWGSNP